MPLHILYYFQLLSFAVSLPVCYLLQVSTKSYGLCVVLWSSLPSTLITDSALDEFAKIITNKKARKLWKAFNYEPSVLKYKIKGRNFITSATLKGCRCGWDGQCTFQDIDHQALDRLANNLT